MGAASEDGLIVRDASELRIKETDRISTIAENFKRMGLAIELHQDGFEVPGKQKFHAAELDSFGDHRERPVAPSSARSDPLAYFAGL